MRMIGIGLLGFLLAAVALLLSTMNVWERAQWAFQNQIHGPQLVFETPAAASANDTNTAVITRSNPDQSVILSGLPAFQSITFDLPENARPTSGTLQIDATLQALAGVEGILRVSIDNVRRGEILLTPGDVRRSLQVPLSADDLSRDQLAVSFSLQGDSSTGECSSDASIATIVEIETTSAIHLTLDRPLTTIRDRVSAWGGLVRVGWPRWLDRKEQARRLVLATQLKQHNAPTVFIDDHSIDAFSTSELREVLPVVLSTMHRRKEVTWPKQVAVDGPNAGVRRFQDTTRWRIPVDLRQDQKLRIPSELMLHLTLGRQALADQWSVTVTLNDRLVYEDFLDSRTSRLTRSIALPETVIAASNTIEVTATSTRTKAGRCSQPIPLLAEMLPETVLLAGDSTFSDPLSMLQSHLSSIEALRIGAASNLTAADADAASSLLAQVVPIDVDMRPVTDVADIVVITPNDLDVSLPADAAIWFVSRAPNANELLVTNLVDNDAIPTGAFGLLIATSGINLLDASL